MFRCRYFILFILLTGEKCDSIRAWSWQSIQKSNGRALSIETKKDKKSANKSMAPNPYFILKFRYSVAACKTCSHFIQLRFFTFMRLFTQIKPKQSPILHGIVMKCTIILFLLSQISCNACSGSHLDACAFSECESSLAKPNN